MKDERKGNEKNGSENAVLPTYGKAAFFYRLQSYESGRHHAENGIKKIFFTKEK